MIKTVLLGLCISFRAAHGQDLVSGTPEQERPVYAALRVASYTNEFAPFVFFNIASWRPSYLRITGEAPAEHIWSFLERDAVEPMAVSTLLPGLRRPTTESLPGEDPAAWRALRNQFGNQVRLVILSRVGFDSTFTQAVVFIAEECGGRCGSKETRFTLRKGDSGWEITSRGTLIE